MNWTEARLYCQRNHIDLVTWTTVNDLAEWLVTINVSEIWIGLLRDPEEESVWKGINVISGEGVSGDDLSQSSNWAEGQQSSHCAAVGSDLMWHSVQCSSEYHVYCSDGKIVFHMVILSWYDASKYCEEIMSNLATITDNNSDTLNYSGWIGLYRQGGQNWSWVGDSSSDYRNWAPEEPLTADCGSFNPVTEKWYSNVCSKELRFVCNDDNLVVVNENKTWEEAVVHCRGMTSPCAGSSDTCMYRHDILSLPNLNDYSYVRDRIYRATTDEVWLGLRFLGGEWWWVNGEELDDDGMLPECPSQWNHCGTLSKYDTDSWITRDCSERRNFICYRKEILIEDNEVSHEEV
ncbi:secretory phospholipase A2 receptor-like [Toxotes jaculatrix]|uniref:secretory phospholipase A2 receptor-like n=1 Tax=Toxotes jaculatrix TaxID=941984 RepID=UPI001B3ABA16|nr:secretory phospholipase A2 receptor-like [Toxotes jaculatrix]